MSFRILYMSLINLDQDYITIILYRVQLLRQPLGKNPASSGHETPQKSEFSNKSYDKSDHWITNLLSDFEKHTMCSRCVSWYVLWSAFTEASSVLPGNLQFTSVPPVKSNSLDGTQVGVLLWGRNEPPVWPHSAQTHWLPVIPWYFMYILIIQSYTILV